MFDFIIKYFRRKKTYEISLPELVTISLNKKSLEDLVHRIDSRRDISNIHPESEDSQRYMTKLLSEEVEKQFSEEKRPLVELVSNAIDARPNGFMGEYQVNISIGGKSFEVQDQGNSMNLKQLLTTLIIPFETNKDALMDIGRFGVGFLSNLQYCLDNPNQGTVVVESASGNSKYRLTFQSTSDDIRDLKCRIDVIDTKQKGTKVRISGFKMPKGLGHYLKDYLGFFDSNRAQIKLNRRMINQSGKNGFSEYNIPVKLTVEGNEIEQTARLAIAHGDVSEKKNEIRYYSQGMLVLKDEALGGAIRVDFPSAVQVVEGRDELKKDSNYGAVLDSVWNQVLEYCKKHTSEKDRDALRYLTCFFHHADGNHMRRENDFKEVFFPDKTYALAEDNESYLQALSFFGKELAPEIYSDSRPMMKQLWSSKFLSFYSLVKRETEIIGTASKEELVQGKTPELQLIKNATALNSNHDYTLIRLKRFQGGSSPFIHVSDNIYLNVNHPFFVNEGDFGSRYGIKTSLQEAKGVTENSIENRLISRGQNNAD